MALLDKECLATTQYSTLSLNKKIRGSKENEANNGSQTCTMATVIYVGFS